MIDAGRVSALRALGAVRVVGMLASAPLHDAGVRQVVAGELLPMALKELTPLLTQGQGQGKAPLKSAGAGGGGGGGSPGGYGLGSSSSGSSKSQGAGAGAAGAAVGAGAAQSVVDPEAMKHLVLLHNPQCAAAALVALARLEAKLRGAAADAPARAALSSLMGPKGAALAARTAELQGAAPQLGRAVGTAGW